MRALVIGALALLLWPGIASAAPEDVANDVSEQIMSPFCPGVTLHDCPSDSAVALRDRIELLAEEGFDREEIISLLERDYGTAIRAVPAAEGSGLWAWVVPVLAALGGAAIGWLLLRRWVHVPAPPDAYDETVHITPADRQRLDRELKKLRGNA